MKDKAKLNGAIEVLEAQLQEQLQEVAETKKTINMLRKRMGEDPLYLDVSVEQTSVIRADLFFGKPLATAVQEYLERRKHAVTAQEILNGLTDGGFDFDVVSWKENDRLRSLAISLAKNTLKFVKLKNNTFGLRSWYDEDFLKKAAANRKDASETDQNGQTTQTKDDAKQVVA